MLRLRSGQSADTGDLAASAGLLNERDDRATTADQPLVIAGRVAPGLRLDPRGRVARVLRARNALVAERAQHPRVYDDGRARGGQVRRRQDAQTGDLDHVAGDAGGLAALAR